MMEEWFVYLLLCTGDKLYCGVAKDPEKRFLQHQSGKGARYTRANPALRILYTEGPLSQGEALRRERAIKALSRKSKEALFQSQPD